MIRRIAGLLLAVAAGVAAVPAVAHATTSPYEFETTHAALPVLDQGTAGVCTFAVFANELNAARRATGHPTAYGIDVAETAVNDGDSFTFATPDGPMTLTLGPEVTVGTDRDGIRSALLTDGVVGLFVPSTAPGFAAAYHPYVRTPRVPVIRWAHDTAPVDHEVLAVGYTDRGVMVLNSWGPAFGDQGHAVLSWGFLRHYGAGYVPVTSDAA